MGKTIRAARGQAPSVQQIYSDISFKSNVVTAGGLAVLLAAILDLIVLTVQRLLTPWRRARFA